MTKVIDMLATLLLLVMVALGLFAIGYCLMLLMYAVWGLLIGS